MSHGCCPYSMSLIWFTCLRDDPWWLDFPCNYWNCSGISSCRGIELLLLVPRPICLPISLGRRARKWCILLRMDPCPFPIQDHDIHLTQTQPELVSPFHHVSLSMSLFPDFTGKLPGELVHKIARESLTSWYVLIWDSHVLIAPRRSENAIFRIFSSHVDTGLPGD